MPLYMTSGGSNNNDIQKLFLSSYIRLFTVNCYSISITLLDQQDVMYNNIVVLKHDLPVLWFYVEHFIGF